MEELRVKRGFEVRQSREYKPYACDGRGRVSPDMVFTMMSGHRMLRQKPAQPRNFCLINKIDPLILSDTGDIQSVNTLKTKNKTFKLQFSSLDLVKKEFTHRDIDKHLYMNKNVNTLGDLWSY